MEKVSAHNNAQHFAGAVLTTPSFIERSSVG
jgi:hypothetical protein